MIAEKTLLVEGPSDIIYLLDAVRKLKTFEMIDIDLNDLSVVDAGDSQNYLAMAKLMLSEGRDIVAMLDGDSGGKAIEEQLKKVCAAELKNKKLKIYALPENKSSEDIFANLETLRAATRLAFNELVNDKARNPADNLSLTEELNKIAPSTTMTLGRTLDNVTKSLFSPPEKMSKLLIAILYEDKSKDNSKRVPDEALAQLEKIKDLLNLRGEKSTELGVFEETV